MGRKYIRKTTDEWEIQGYYRHGWETVCAEDTDSEARERLRECRENEPGVPFRKIRRHIKKGELTDE